MVDIGKINRLRIIKEKDFGLYLDGEALGEILLPRQYVDSAWKIGDWVEVFIYLDSEDRLVATTQTPHIMVGECAYLKVAAVNQVGAFLDWGLIKDLFVPFAEQTQPLKEGRSYVVYAYVDNNNRIAASTRLDKFLTNQSSRFSEGDAVDLLIWQPTDLGYMAVINNQHLGLIFQQDVFQPIQPGDRIEGYIKRVRDDLKIDLSLQPKQQAGRDELSQKILDHLKAEGGTSLITDKSPPEAIYKLFSVSKGSYKKALGTLYKQRLITLDKACVRLVDK